LKIYSEKVKKRVNDFLLKLKSEKIRQKKLKIRLLFMKTVLRSILWKILNIFWKDKLTFVAGRCSNHAMRALDDLGSHVVEFSYKELEKYWSPYAKNLLQVLIILEEQVSEISCTKEKLMENIHYSFGQPFYPEDDSSEQVLLMQNTGMIKIKS
jgi:hypothetical protein